MISFVLINFILSINQSIDSIKSIRIIFYFNHNKDIRALINGVDKNYDGKISLDEFLHSFELSQNQ